MVTQFGESFVGEGANAAHLNTVLGTKGGPVETAWVTSLATPTPGLVRFVTVLQPGLPVKPMTLFVPKSAIEGETHARMTWGPAQAGVAAGVATAVTRGIVAPWDEDSKRLIARIGEPSSQAAMFRKMLVDDLLLIAAVWVDPAADDADAVFANNRDATLGALEAGARQLPSLEEVLAAREKPFNPFYPGPGPGL